ncbi:hypothetical protein V1264_002611 [Littorina saxatilis]|uniref:Uncharacterized protein n=1 Tax=Littorina saxatilis TaxID=31220 RepID=A0AAN9B3Q3_9CAEN
MRARSGVVASGVGVGRPATFSTVWQRCLSCGETTEISWDEGQRVIKMEKKDPWPTKQRMTFLEEDALT